VDFLKVIPLAVYTVFRIIGKLVIFAGILFFLFIPAFLLSFVPQLLFGWGPGPSISVMYALVILAYIGYRMSR